jgi:hypothetical protein
MKTKFFLSADHALNVNECKRRTKNGKQPVKKLSAGELAKFAADRGMVVSVKTVETAKKAIDISALPESLRKFIKAI